MKMDREQIKTAYAVLRDALFTTGSLMADIEEIRKKATDGTL